MSEDFQSVELTEQPSNGVKTDVSGGTEGIRRASKEFLNIGTNGVVWNRRREYGDTGRSGKWW